MAPLALVQSLVIRWRHLHWLQSWPLGWVTWIATLPYWHYQLVLSWYPYQPVTSVKSAQRSWSDLYHNPNIGPQGPLGPIKIWKNWLQQGSLHFGLLCLTPVVQLRWQVWVFEKLKVRVERELLESFSGGGFLLQLSPQPTSRAKRKWSRQVIERFRTALTSRSAKFKWKQWLKIKFSEWNSCQTGVQSLVMLQLLIVRKLCWFEWLSHSLG